MIGGGEDFHRLRPINYPNTDVFLLCFSVDNRDSFRGIGDTWRDSGNLIMSAKGPFINGVCKPLGFFWPFLLVCIWHWFTLYM